MGKIAEGLKYHGWSVCPSIHTPERLGTVHAPHSDRTRFSTLLSYSLRRSCTQIKDHGVRNTRFSTNLRCLTDLIEEQSLILMLYRWR